MSIKMIFASAAAIALAAGSPAFAAKGSQAEQASAQGGSVDRSESKAERKTCRTIDKTESRMDRTRLCLTREQWKKFDDEASQ